MIHDKRDFFIGFLTASCAILLIAAGAPSQWGVLSDPDQPSFLKNGGNAHTIPEGTEWNLAGVTIIVDRVISQELIASVTAETPRLHLTPQLSTSQQIALRSSSDHDVTIYSVEEAGEAVVQHVEGGEAFPWLIASASYTESSTDEMRVAANNQLRVFASAFETR